MAEDDSTIIVPIDDDSSLGGSTQPSFTSGITNALGAVAGLQAIGSIATALSDIFTTQGAPADFIVPDLANNGSPSLGSSGSSGGLFGSSSIVNTVDPTIDDDLLASGISPRTWEALDFVLNKTLTMDWTVRNADPGNENILEAYRFAGRGFTQDGGTGQFSWAAAFATWVLVKSGFQGLRTMAPSAFRTYGDSVRFHAGPLTNVRKWDMVIFTSNVNIQHIGFIQSFDPAQQTMQIIGGDQAETVKVTSMPYSVSNPLFRVTHVRRNWTIPTGIDTSIFATSASPAPAANNVLPVLPSSTITIQPLPPAGSTPEEIEAFNRRYPPRATDDPRAQFGPYTLNNSRPTTDQLIAAADAAINEAPATAPIRTQPNRGPR